MALQGTIDAFPVVDVLNLLAGSHKTGRLIVEGDRSTAQLFVLDGAVTGGGVQGIDEAPLADVVAELLRYSEGSFLFEPGTLAPAPQEPGDLISLVESARARLDEWSAIEAVVPSMSHRVSLVPAIGVEGVQLSAEEWPLVVAAGQRSKIGEVVAAAGVSDIATCSMIAALVERGVVAVDAPTAEIVLADASRDLGAAAASDAILDEAESDAPLSASVTQHTQARVIGGNPGAMDADATVDDDTAYEVVLLDDETTADGTFPEHFPIDDLIGAGDAEDPWVQMEAAGRDDRLAAAQAFDNESNSTNFSGDGFSGGGPSLDAVSGNGGDSADEADGPEGTDQLERFDAGGLFGAGPATYAEPAVHNGSSAGASSPPDEAFDPSALFGAQPTAGSPSAFDPSGLGPVADSASVAFGGGFTDMGAFTDPISGNSSGSGARTSSTSPTLSATFVGDGAFTEAPAPARAPIAVQDPVPDTAADSAADEVLRQMSKLSPKAAEAIAAALGSSADADGPAR